MLSAMKKKQSEKEETSLDWPQEASKAEMFEHVSY